MEEISSLRKKGKALSPSIRIGQNGLSESTIIEIKKQLKHNKLIKIKFLKNFIEENDKKEAVKELVQKTESVLIDFVGFVVVVAEKQIVFGKNKTPE